ncbi:hypothetical protein GOV06_04730 [Candidatus Woesearchaeota archaeon]|nr:hypothetical protein [Candidatus Woesearchaeota archaeon]
MAGEGESQKRQIACKVRIKKILSGKYIKEEGWTPNYVETDSGKKISRVNIIGIVVSNQEDSEIGYNSIVIDDGTGKISIRVFEDEADKLKGIEIGDVVLIIGRPREYGTERYLLLEIIKKIEDKRWIEIRKKELGKEDEVVGEEKIEEAGIVQKEENIKETVEESVVEEASIGDKIIDYIRENDDGAGVDIEEIIKKYNDENAVKELLSEGELFEVRPGRVKVLE